MKVAPNQIWREVDPRRERFVFVFTVGKFTAEVRSAERGPFGWAAVRGTRVSHPSVERFHGKRGGYEFVENHSAAPPASGDTSEPSKEEAAR